MGKVNLKGYKITSITFVNKIENAVKFEIQNNYSYNVKYAPSNVCRGEFTAKITNKNKPEDFSITLVMVGVFTYDAGMEKEFIHVDSFNQLFPYVRAAVTTVTANAGIPPIIIPTTDISGQNIYRFEKNV